MLMLDFTLDYKFIVMNNSDRAIVMFAIGEKYLKSFNETFRPSIERYARKINTETIVVEELIRPSSKKIYWQRLVMFSHPVISKYDKVLMVDSDIYITKHARNIFDVVGERPWGICKNNAYDLPTLALTDISCYEDCPKKNRPSFLTNSGMYVISKSYQNNLEKIYAENQIREARGYDMGPISYFLLNDKNGVILSSEFNTIVVSYIEKYGCALSSILKMYDSASFIHFAANKWHSIFIFVRWFDTTEFYLSKRLVRFLGRRQFDFITAPAFKIFQHLVGIYNYRFRKFFSKSSV